MMNQIVVFFVDNPSDFNRSLQKCRNFMTNLIIYTLKKTNVSLVIREFRHIFALSN